MGLRPSAEIAVVLACGPCIDSMIGAAAGCSSCSRRRRICRCRSLHGI